MESTLEEEDEEDEEEEEEEEGDTFVLYSIQFHAWTLCRVEVSHV